MASSRAQALWLQGILRHAAKPEVRAQIIEAVCFYRMDIYNQFSIAESVRKFMTWLSNVPVCECGAVMSTSIFRLDHEIIFVPDASKWTGYRAVPGLDTHCRKIERYVCSWCHLARVVTRENDPLMIFKTHTGRCGEYAILYASILLALGYRARLVETTINDHVWVEVLVADKWVPVDVAAEDVLRLIKNRLLFKEWGWRLDDLYAVEPDLDPVDVSEDYR